MGHTLPLSKLKNMISNFRDIAEFNRGYVKKGMIYRSSSPIEYQSNSLKQLFRDVGIRSIIDLRSAVEIKMESYTDEFIRDFNYYWVHVDISMPPEVFLDEGVEHLPLYKQFCWYVLNYNKNQIRKIFDILSRPSNYSVIIHCFAGRDRTGILSALILMLLGAPEEGIIKDYLASDTFTEVEDIQYVIDFVKSKGGIREYLNRCGISLSVQGRVKSLLKI